MRGVQRASRIVPSPSFREVLGNWNNQRDLFKGRRRELLVSKWGALRAPKRLQAGGRGWGLKYDRAAGGDIRGPAGVAGSGPGADSRHALHQPPRQRRDGDHGPNHLLLRTGALPTAEPPLLQLSALHPPPPRLPHLHPRALPRRLLRPQRNHPRLPLQKCLQHALHHRLHPRPLETLPKGNPHQSTGVLGEPRSHMIAGISSVVLLGWGSWGHYWNRNLLGRVEILGRFGIRDGEGRRGFGIRRALLAVLGGVCRPIGTDHQFLLQFTRAFQISLLGESGRTALAYLGEVMWKCVGLGDLLRLFFQCLIEDCFGEVLFGRGGVLEEGLPVLLLVVLLPALQTASLLGVFSTPDRLPQLLICQRTLGFISLETAMTQHADTVPTSLPQEGTLTPLSLLCLLSPTSLLIIGIKYQLALLFGLFHGLFRLPLSLTGLHLPVEGYFLLTGLLLHLELTHPLLLSPQFGLQNLLETAGLVDSVDVLEGLLVELRVEGVDELGIGSAAVVLQGVQQPHAGERQFVGVSQLLLVGGGEDGGTEGELRTGAEGFAWGFIGRLQHNIIARKNSSKTVLHSHHA